MDVAKTAKPVPDALSRTVRSNLEKNQIPRPAINVQKNIGTKVSTANARSARNETKSGKSSAANSFIQQSRKNVVNSTSTNSQPRRAAKENISSQGVPSAMRQACGQASNGCLDGAIRVGVSLPQISSSICGKMPCVQAQTMKPSGLRMPSPSLGFFGQSKAPASHNLLPSTLRSLPKSNIPNVAKGGPLKPTCERSPSRPAILREVAHDVTTGITAAKCSSAGQFASSSVNHTSHEKTESNLPTSNNRNVEDRKSPLHQGPHKHLKEEDGDKRVPEVCDDFSGVHNANEQHGELTELLKPDVFEAQLISHEKHQINTEIGSSTEFKKIDCENRADACLKAQVSTESELEMCHGLSRKEGAARVDSRKLDAEDAHLHSLRGSLLVESGKDILRSLNGDNEKFMVVDDLNRQCEQSKLPSFSHQESILENILRPEKSDACGSELKSSPLCLIPSAVTDYGSNTEDIAQCLHMEDKLSSPLINESAIENCNSTGPQSLDIELQGTEDLERIENVKREDARSACKDEVTIVSPTNRDVAGSDLDKQHWSPNFGPAVVQAEVGALEISDIIAHERLEGKNHRISLRNHNDIYDLQSRDDVNHNQQSTLMGHYDWSSTTRDRIVLPFEQAMSIKPWSHEDDKVSNNENHWRGSYEGLMFDKSRLSEESPKFNRGNSADVIPETKCSNGNGFEGADHLSHYIHAEKETTEVESFINVIEKSPMEPAKSLAFEGCTSSVGCRDNPNTSKCFVIINDVSEQREDPRLPDPSPDAAQVSLSLSRLHSDDKFFFAGKSSSQESPERNELGVASHAASELWDACAKLKFPDVCARVVPTILDGAVDDKADRPQPENDARLVSTETNLNGGFDLFLNISEDQTSEAVGTCPKPIRCSSEDLVLSRKINQRQSSGSIPQDIEVTLVESRIFPQVGTNVVEKRSYDGCQPQHELEDAPCSVEDDGAPVLLKESDNEKKTDVLLMKPPPDAVPFSDEWLAAFEAAGEEIFTMKSGAVQNSPPDKPLPEPGPWSPVRRKNQEVGPFDCTKYTNTNVSP
ncbi:uncharacterized protein LOC120002020 isoform X2 [Tripterygium wilfordii]|nr:uncharacterized protein LOC120002020 isoform X2 [Tripterygium wilfordii]